MGKIMHECFIARKIGNRAINTGDIKDFVECSELDYTMWYEGYLNKIGLKLIVENEVISTTKDDELMINIINSYTKNKQKREALNHMRLCKSMLYQSEIFEVDENNDVCIKEQAYGKEKMLDNIVHSEYWSFEPSDYMINSWNEFMRIYYIPKINEKKVKSPMKCLKRINNTESWKNATCSKILNSNKINELEDIFIPVDGSFNKNSKNVGVVTQNQEEKILLRETLDVKKIAHDAETTEFAALMIGVGIANIHEEIFEGKALGVYNDCKTAIDAINVCKRGQFKKLTHKHRAMLHNVCKDLHQKTITEWISTKSEYSQEGKETQEAMIVIADEMSKKKPTMIIDKMSHKIKLVSDKYEEECKEMNIKQKINYHCDIYLMKEIIKIKLNVESETIAKTRTSIAKKFKNKTKGLVKLCHGITRCESSGYVCPKCNQNMDSSHVYTCILSNSEKNEIIKESKEMIKKGKIVSNYSHFIDECMQATLCKDVTLSRENPQFEYEPKYWIRGFMSDKWREQNVHHASGKDNKENKNVSVMISIISLIVKKAFESWSKHVEQNIEKDRRNSQIKNRVIDKGCDREKIMKLNYPMLHVLNKG